MTQTHSKSDDPQASEYDDSDSTASLLQNLALAAGAKRQALHRACEEADAESFQALSTKIPTTRKSLPQSTSRIAAQSGNFHYVLHTRDNPNPYVRLGPRQSLLGNTSANHRPASQFHDSSLPLTIGGANYQPKSHVAACPRAGQQR